MFDKHMCYLQCSDQWLTDYHLQGRNVIGQCYYEMFPDLPERWKQVHQRVLAGAIESCDEDPFEQADGGAEWVQWECRPWCSAAGEISGLMISSQIITARKLAEESVRASLREKEVLLKEIHHRVKNNLQIVSTLLDLQADYTQDARALEMFKESCGRVKSMALIHERLYRTQDLARVNFAEYVRQLADDLFLAYKVSDDDIAFVVDVTIPPVPIDIAIPCGLLLNELISNCLKHAFRGLEQGTVTVSLQPERGKINLRVMDTGVGLPRGFDFRNTTSFGLQLVMTLVEQLQGDIAHRVCHGSEIVVTFPMRG